MIQFKTLNKECLVVCDGLKLLASDTLKSIRGKGFSISNEKGRLTS